MCCVCEFVVVFVVLLLLYMGKLVCVVCKCEVCVLCLYVFNEIDDDCVKFDVK